MLPVDDLPTPLLIDGVLAIGIGLFIGLEREHSDEQLGFLGVHLDASKNEAGATVISRQGERVSVRVICTDEERVIAEAVVQILDTHRSAKAGVR